MDDTLRFFRWLTAQWPTSACIELRILPRRGAPLVGFYTPDGLAAACHAVHHWGTGTAQVYCGINPRGAHLLTVAHNRLVVTKKDDPAIRAGEWGDVVAVTVILIDLDPIRPSHTASTDTELAAARRLALEIDQWWQEQGWPAPLAVMSGNGYHLWAQVPPQDPRTFPSHLRAFLAEIAGRFGNAAVDVDVSVADAPRIAKVPGSVSIKGENSVDRPWRQSAIVGWADPLPNQAAANHIRSLSPVHSQRAGGQARAKGAAPEGLKPRPLLDAVLERCHFMQWAREHPTGVREPAWYALATNLTVFEGGVEAFHELSAGYPGYDHGEAAAKFEHAQRSPGPTTCQHLAELGALGYQCPLLHACPARSPAGLAHVTDAEWRLYKSSLAGSTDPGRLEAARILGTAIGLARNGGSMDQAVELATVALGNRQDAQRVIRREAERTEG